MNLPRIQSTRLFILIAVSLFTTTTQAQYSITCIGLGSDNSSCADKRKTIGYGEAFYFQLNDWNPAFNDAENLVLYVNDIPLPYYRSIGVSQASKKVFFQMEVKKLVASGETKTINELVRRDFESWNNKLPLTLSFGTADKKIKIDNGKLVDF